MPAHLDEATLAVFAVTVNSKHTLVVMQHVAGSTEAALLAGGGDFRAGAPTEALWVRAGRQAGGKAAGKEAVGGALKSYGVEGERLVEMNRGGLVSQMLLKKKSSWTNQQQSLLSNSVPHSANIYGGCRYSEH